MVDKLTRKSAKLDFIFTSNPASMDECSVADLAPITDHRQVHTTIHTMENVSKGTTAQATIEPAGTSLYDIRGHANHCGSHR